MPPSWIENKIFYDKKLKYNDISATKIRFSKQNLDYIKSSTTKSVSKAILKNKFFE